MKVAKGKAKGSQLKKPIIKDVNPIMSFERERIFDEIENNLNFDFNNKVGIDLFAGTGSLGIEALSNGARKVDFIDKHPEAVKAIKGNLQRAGFVGRGWVHEKDVFQYLSEKVDKYDFIFIDPGPNYTSISQITPMLYPKLNPNGIVLIRTISVMNTNFYRLSLLKTIRLNRGMIFVLKRLGI